MSDDPIARAALGMAAALRERRPGCKLGLPTEERVEAAYHVVKGNVSPLTIQCRLYRDERLALAAYEKAAGS